IAFEGCAEDHAQTAIHDLGFRAVVLPGGERAFRVTVGGGTAVRPTSGSVLEEALPAGELLASAEAVLRVYHRRGDYQHRGKNRIKYLIKEIGFTAFHEEYATELLAIRAGGVPPLPFPVDEPPVEEEPQGARPAPPAPAEIAARVTAGPPHGPGLHPPVEPVLPRPILVVDDLLDDALARWAESNVRPQRQPRYSLVTVTLPLGDVTAAQLRVIADLAASYGDGTARLTAEQNLLLRWVKSQDVAPLYRALSAAGLGTGGAGTLADVVSCPGAESCKLAITRSRGLGKLLVDSLREQPELVAAGPGIDIKVSGCPNGCSRHHVAGIGFQGSVRRLGERLVPQYFVTVGGGVDEGGAHFGRLVAKVPARRGPEVVQRLLALYLAERAPGEPPLAFLQRLEPQRAKAALADLEKLSVDDALPVDFIDLGDEAPIEVITMEGECSA
ncbi:MAG TPA: nitrite/sulfite reductase, partial [Thermoanaerobaculia bacterium]|nr:nitrite/sulfite reductase [Thermoanaerobaculia bacterium]